MKHPELMDIYSDYLLASFTMTSATGLSQILDNGYSHDQISRFLAQKELSQKDYWQKVKNLIRKVENPELGIIAIDDTIEEKPHSTENELISWHFDHSKGLTIKGINILNFLYISPCSDIENVSIPLAYELIKKTEKYVAKVKNKEVIKRRSPTSKNELLIKRLRILTQINKVKYSYLTWDSWFSSKANFNFVHHEIKKVFVACIQDNRLIALSKEDKTQGKYINIRNLNLQSNTLQSVWLKGLDFPVLIGKQTFINKGDSVADMYVVTNDLNLSFEQVFAIYKKRWNVETFHKSLKNNASLAKSPTKYEATQANHIFASMLAFCKLEVLKFKEGLNHFALKSKLYIKAIKASFQELQNLKNSLKKQLIENEQKYLIL